MKKATKVWVDGSELIHLSEPRYKGFFGYWDSDYNQDTCAKWRKLILGTTKLPKGSDLDEYRMTSKGFKYVCTWEVV